MTRRLAFASAFLLATAATLPANWNLNPFKRSKEGKATSSAPGANTKDAKSDSTHEFDSQYLGGTVAGIPQYTNGKLDLSDAHALRFHYGKPTWTVDYAKITTIEVGDRKTSPRILKVPKLMKEKRVFTIGFKSEKGVLHTLMLEVPTAEALAALPLLEERTGKAATVEGAQDPDHRWTDRYWKTTSNTDVWDEASGRNKAAVAAVK